jgi:hypothetical protein
MNRDLAQSRMIRAESFMVRACLVCTVTTWVPGRTGSNYAVRHGQVLDLSPGEAHYLLTNYPDVFRRG